MVVSVKARTKTASPADSHRAWLELVETDGPFLAVPPLLRVWPHGMPALEPVRRDIMRTAKTEFEVVWEKTDAGMRLGEPTAVEAYRAARDTWVRTLLETVIGWQRYLEWPPVVTVPGAQASSPNQTVIAIPTALLRGPDGVGALVYVVDRVDSLHQAGTDGWAATPIDRLEHMLRDSGIEIGVVTDGRWWALVCARPSVPVASGIVDSQTWIEESRARDAFLTLLDRQYLIGGDPDERLPNLFAASVAEAEEITEALGAQVRRAVETLVQAFSETAIDARRRGQTDPLPDDPHEVYRGAVTVMMRVVFLLFAEQRGLLPTSALFTEGYGISGELDRLEHRALREHEEALDSTYLTWHRLLATSQALFGGASFENMRMPAYGGSLFDPAHTPMLTQLGPQGTLALPVSDRVMLAVLRAVQVAELKGQPARRISFRDVDVEQIGYIYEGLLGFSCTVVRGQAILGLVGTAGEEPEIPLGVLERLASDHPEPKNLAAAVIAWIKEDQPASQAKTTAAMAKLLISGASEQADRMLRTVTSDARLRQRIRRFAGIIRTDLRGRPVVVLDGGLLVVETPSRRHSGAHYTPRTLAEEVVHHTLEPLCYSPGPHMTNDSSEWRLRPSAEILALKVADIACGSGAFLVSAARYLAARLVEAWATEQPETTGRADIQQHAIRQVVAKCIYGADINPMAVEMCKLSLWLVSLDRDLSFSFVDDKILCGNSLLGLTSLDQLRYLHFNPQKHHQISLLGPGIDDTITEAAELRRRLATEIDEHDPQRSTSAKQRQLARIRDLTAQLRHVADGVIAAGLALGGKPGRALEEAYDTLRAAVRLSYPPNGEPGDAGMLDRIIRGGLTPTVRTEYTIWQPLHWALEAPDVMADRGGFDVIVGNPPFLAGKKIVIANGSNVESWTKQDLRGARGSADLSAHFIRRAWALLAPNGSLGLISTGRVGQGDTAAMSTQILIDQGTLYRAVSAFRWPGKASTGAAIIWASRRPPGSSKIRPFLNGKMVSAISPSLTDANKADVTAAAPLRLPFLAGKGVSPYGDGLVLEFSHPILRLCSNAEKHALRPFVNGQTLMSGAPSGRFAIDAGSYRDEDSLFNALPTLAAHLRSTVKPVRDAITSQTHEHRYWAFWDKREKLFHEADRLDRFIVLAKATRFPVFLFWEDHHSLLSDQVIVIASDSASVIGTLSSTVHAAWFEQMRTGRGSTSEYVVSRCLRTFPFPDLELPNLRRAADDFLIVRGEALSKVVSPTKLYNMVDDPAVALPEVERLREAQVALDSAVVASYGWDGIDLSYGYFELAGVRRFTCDSSHRDEIRRFLLNENHRFASISTPKSVANKRSAERVPKGMKAVFS